MVVHVHRTRAEHTSLPADRSSNGIELCIRLGSDRCYCQETDDSNKSQHQCVLDHRGGFVILDEVADHHANVSHFFLQNGEREVNLHRSVQTARW